MELGPGEGNYRRGLNVNRNKIRVEGRNDSGLGGQSKVHQSKTIVVRRLSDFGLRRNFGKQG